MTTDKRIINRTDSQVDVTGGIECYQNGKTFRCICGLWHGVKLGCKATKCPRCNRTCIDRKADDREAPEVDQGQTTLGQW